MLTARDLVGLVVLCPHCTQPLRIESVLHGIIDGVGIDQSVGYVVELEDGELARFWVSGPKSQ